MMVCTGFMMVQGMDSLSNGVHTKQLSVVQLFSFADKSCVISECSD